MRTTSRTTIFAALTILLLVTLWPRLDPSNAAAQSGPPATGRTMKKAALFKELSQARIEAILAEPIPEVSFFQQPLREVVVGLNEMTGINIFFDPEELGDIIDPDVPVEVQLAENSVTFETLLNFILEPNDLTFVIRENYLVIMSYDKWIGTPEATKLVVYNCRDLIEPLRKKEETAVSYLETKGESLVQFGGSIEEGDGVGRSAIGATHSSSPDEQFMLVIAHSVSPGT